MSATDSFWDQSPLEKSVCDADVVGRPLGLLVRRDALCFMLMTVNLDFHLYRCLGFKDRVEMPCVFKSVDLTRH